MSHAFSVIVLEDSDEDFETLKEAVAEPRRLRQVRRAVDGEECLQLIDEERPALVLLDLNTPGMDGRDTLLALRADERLQCMPIVVLSTSSNPRDIAQCYARGANAYHVKPVRYLDHLALVQAVLEYWFRWTLLAAEEETS